MHLVTTERVGGPRLGAVRCGVVALCWSLAVLGRASAQDAAPAGQPPVDRQPRIRGGTPWTPEGAFEAVGKIGGCTATLISEFAALTAGHCVTNGERRTFTLPNGRGSIDGTVVRHPLYGLVEEFSHDVAIISFDQSIFDDTNVDTSGLAPMPISERNVRPGQGAFIYGYGGFGDDCSEPADGQARYAWIAITSVDEDWDHTLTSETYGVCGGDSGGPLAIDDGGWKIAGVNSRKSGDSTRFEPIHPSADWIREHASGPGLPGNTWGQCVLYTNWTDGAYLSLPGNLPSFADYASYDDATSSVWVKKGFTATLYDGANYGGAALRTVDGFTGSRCNEFGCIYDLAGSSANDKASSVKCGSALPQSTWGHCVYYSRFGNGAYYSTQGDTPAFTGEFASWNNRISQVWVKRGYTAELFSRESYGESPYWPSLTLEGDGGDRCNSFGCLYDLAATFQENTASSITCR